MVSIHLFENMNNEFDNVSREKFAVDVVVGADVLADRVQHVHQHDLQL